MATAGVDRWTLSCRRCGVEFTVDVHRGRPPGVCDRCREKRDWTPLRLVMKELEEQNRRAGPHAVLVPEEIARLQRLKREGWKVEHLATAFGVSTRTVQRYLMLYPPQLMTVGQYAAWFAQRSRGKRRDPDVPVQLTPWRKVT